MNAEQDRLNKDPSVPQGLPAGRAIALAGEKAANAGNGAAERANRPGGMRALVQKREDIKPLLSNEMSGRQVWRKVRELPEPKQAHTNGSQEGQQILEGSHSVYVSFLR